MCAIQVYIILIYNIYYTSIYKIHIYMNMYISTYIYTSEFSSLDGMSFPVLKFRETVDIVGLRRRVKGKANIKRTKKLIMYIKI